MFCLRNNVFIPEHQYSVKFFSERFVLRKPWFDAKRAELLVLPGRLSLLQKGFETFDSILCLHQLIKIDLFNSF